MHDNTHQISVGNPKWFAPKMLAGRALERFRVLTGSVTYVKQWIDSGGRPVKPGACVRW
jgi:hypothetical protein